MLERRRERREESVSREIGTGDAIKRKRKRQKEEVSEKEIIENVMGEEDKGRCCRK